MRPTLRQLQYLVAIADTGKFHDAARQTNVSQPSLSAQIADMEAGLGITLVDRGRGGAFLTPAGHEIVRRARTILTLVEDLKSSANAMQGVIAGRFRLGTIPTISPYLLPSAVRQLHALFPDLRISVREERTIDLEAKLNDGQLDMIISTAEDHIKSEALHLFEEQLYICTAPDDKLAEKTGPVSLSELKGREFLSLGYGHRLSLLVQSVADAAGAHVSTEYEGTSLDAIRQMSGMGAGVAILPSLYALVESQHDQAQIIRPINHPSARRSISLIWRPTSPLSESINRIGEVLKDVANDLLTKPEARKPAS